MRGDNISGRGLRRILGRPAAVALLKTLLGCGLVLGSAELAMRLFGVGADRQYRVMQALVGMERRQLPVAVRTDLPWPGRSLRVRVPCPGADPPPPYVVGGRRIEGADPSRVCQDFLPPDFPRGPWRFVFVVGGSAALGYPYPFEAGFSAGLDERLAPLGIRVLNASQLGWSSGELVPVAQRIAAEYRPHALVLFLGNNEWIHWSTGEQPWVGRRVLRAYRRLARSRLLAAALHARLQRQAARQEVGRRGETGFRIHTELAGYEYALAHPLQHDPGPAGGGAGRLSRSNSSTRSSATCA